MRALEIKPHLAFVKGRGMVQRVRRIRLWERQASGAVSCFNS